MLRSVKSEDTSPKVENREIELLMIANSLHKTLTDIAEGRPYLNDDPYYRSLIDRSYELIYGPAEEDTIRQLFDDARAFFCEYRKPIGVVASLVSARAKLKTLNSYFPGTFEEFAEQSKAESSSEYLEESLVCAAEATIMGELEWGIDTVVPRFRQEVKNRVFEMVADANPDMEDLSFNDIGRFLDAVRIKNEMFLMERFPDLAEIIIKTRSSIDQEYGKGKVKPMPKLGPAGDTTVSETTKRLLIAVVKGKKGLTPEEYRKTKSSRIAPSRPRFAIVTPDDEPDGIDEDVPDEIPEDVLRQMRAEGLL